MGLPLYREVCRQATPPRTEKANAGLWFQRFFDRYNHDWSIADDKIAWLKMCAGKVGNASQLQATTLSQYKLADSLNGDSMVYTSNWHFVTGMGNLHPVENGLSWHPTLGVPYLSGAAVKGLLRAWIEQWCYSDEQEDERQSCLLQWFGSTSKDPKSKGYASRRGDLIFFDAIPTEPVWMGVDIMTPHMGKWYELGGQIASVDEQPERVPADWHDPTPIPFLTAHKINLLFTIAPRDSQAAACTDLSRVMNTLQEALEWLGAGAKTAVGYGDMKPQPNKKAVFADQVAAEKEAQKDKERTASMNAVAKKFYQQMRDGKWETDKNSFWNPSRIKEWLTEMEKQPEQYVIDTLQALINQYYPDLLSNPDKVKGKKRRAAYKDHQREIAHRINALLREIQ